MANVNKGGRESQMQGFLFFSPVQRKVPFQGADIDRVGWEHNASCAFSY